MSLFVVLHDSKSYLSNEPEPMAQMDFFFLFKVNPVWSGNSNTRVCITKHTNEIYICFQWNFMQKPTKNISSQANGFKQSARHSNMKTRVFLFFTSLHFFLTLRKHIYSKQVKIKQISTQTIRNAFVLLNVRERYLLK